VTKLSRFLTARFGKLDAQGKFWMWCGLITLAISMGMAYDYGSQVTWKHGGVMAALSLSTAFVLEEAYSYYKRGLYGVAIGFSLVAAPLFWQEAKSHIAYTAGYRGDSVSKVHIQNKKADGADETVAENKAQLAFWQKRLDTLTSQNGWTATVTADGLRAELTAMEGDQVFKRSKGCANVTIPESRIFCDKRAQLQSRIAVLEETSDLSKKIEHAKTVLAGLRDKAGAIERQSSIVEHQQDLLVKVAGLLFKGDSKATPNVAEGVEIENTVSLALMPVILPALFFFMMGLRRQDDTAEPEIVRPAADTVPPIETRFAPPPAVARIEPKTYRSAISTLSVAQLLNQKAAA